MLARLGNVLYWFATAAALIVLLTVTAAVINDWHEGAWSLLAFAAGLAFLVWVVGRALRYVLAAR